jgi:hypothetical protein
VGGRVESSRGASVETRGRLEWGRWVDVQTVSLGAGCGLGRPKGGWLEADDGWIGSFAGHEN